MSTCTPLWMHMAFAGGPGWCRLTYDEREAEERVFVEAITNQYESKEALVYAGGCCARWDRDRRVVRVVL